MGTSSSGSGGGGGNPLIPSWIDNGSLPPPHTSPPAEGDEIDQSNPQDGAVDPESSEENNELPQLNGNGESSVNSSSVGAELSNNRYTAPGQAPYKSDNFTRVNK